MHRVLLFALAFAPALSPAQIKTMVPIDGSGPGRVFEGIGALSAGASSRLLIDYPEAQRKEILDYLFKPHYGAGLQILKVEIGGDMNSTSGSEPSQEHVKGQEDYQRGYEWWLMEQAKARNPGIKLAALEWGTPAWIGNGNFWSQDNIDYQIRWLQHAKSEHGLALDYMGGWNERGYDAQWYIDFKRALMANGFAAKLVAADDIGNTWKVVSAFPGNAAFNLAVDIIGVHYPCGYGSNGDACNSSAEAQQSGKPLWASEEGTQDYNIGAANMAKANNRHYIDGKMTSIINYSVVWCAYASLPRNGHGLMLANTPWSGHYEVGKMLWVCAHTTQFSEVGWRYLDAACGYLGGSRANGSYVTLRSPGSGDYSIIVETLDAAADQTFTFTPAGGLSGAVPRVWRSDLKSDNPADYFVNLPEAQAGNGAYSLTLKKGCVYSISTTTGQAKGGAVAPVPKALPLPYSENFEGYAAGKEARYFSDMNGSFDTAPCAGGRSGGCLAQTAPRKAILWDDFAGVNTVIGDPDWSDYQIQCDVFLQQSGSAQVIGRITGSNKMSVLPGYYLRASDSGSWRLLSVTPDKAEHELAAGKKAFSLNVWHTMKLVMQGKRMEGWIDGSKVATAQDGTFTKGNGAMGLQGWTLAQFDDFSASTPGSTVGVVSGEVPEVEGTVTEKNIEEGPLWLAPRQSSASGARYDARGKAHPVHPRRNRND